MATKKRPARVAARTKKPVAKRPKAIGAKTKRPASRASRVLASKRAKTFRKPSLLVIVLAILLTAAFSYAVVVTLSNNHNWRDLSYEKSLRRSQVKVPGLACGILSPEEVSLLMDNTTLKQVASVERSPLVVTDQCNYDNPNNSNGYADVAIRTFGFANDAAKVYYKEKPFRITVSERDPRGYGDKLYYSAGGFFLLKANQIIEVSASKPGLADTEQEGFARSALNFAVEDL